MRALDDYSDKFAHCASLDEIGEMFRRGILEEGYTASLCPVIASGSAGPQVRWMFRNLPRDWAQLSDQRGIPTRSPALMAARQRTSSFTFADVCDQLPLEQREIWRSVREWGWNNGFVVPVHGPGGYFSYVSIASPEHDLNLTYSNRAEIQMFALLAHERCQALDRASSPFRPRLSLSERELECMRWVAAGKTDWEIGMILSISATTVKFHVNGARRKLGAVTRPQATAILATRGLL
jgi:DNA-binding CsgD family transcriptional regulator